MRSPHKIIFTLLFFVSSFCLAQDNTVFITSDTYNPKKEPFQGKSFYTQIGFSIPITVDNREEEEITSPYQNPDHNNDDSFWEQFTFDGISIDAGVGYHFKKWAAVGINTGFDGRLKAKLAAVPVYGTITLNPHFGGDSSFMLQYGYGHVFALGRGNLSGAYTKYRLGVHIDNYIFIFADVSVIDFPVNNFNNVKSFSLGVDLLNFF